MFISDETVIASWYALDGQTMANGEVFNSNDSHLAAHKTLPFGTKVLVHNPENGKKLIVKITDRGPFKKGRSLDLSKAGAKILGFKEKGLAKLQIRIIEEPDPYE